MMSVALLRLMDFRQTGHWERFGSPGPERFSPAMRASMRQVWQKRWPVALLASIIIEQDMPTHHKLSP